MRYPQVFSEKSPQHLHYIIIYIYIYIYIHELNNHTKLTKYLERIAFCAASELSYTDPRISWLNTGDPPVYFWFAPFFGTVSRSDAMEEDIRKDRQDLFVLGESIV